MAQFWVGSFWESTFWKEGFWAGLTGATFFHRIRWFRQSAGPGAPLRRRRRRR